MHIRGRTRVGALLGAALVLAGCSSTLDSGAVRPGTTLEFGEPAVLEMPAVDSEDVEHEEGEIGLLEASVTRIEERPREEVAELDVAEEEPDFVPYYVFLQVDGVDETSEKIARAALLLDMASVPAGGEEDRDYLSNINVLGGPGGGFDACDSSLPDDWNAESSAEVCFFFMAEPGTTISEVHYLPRDTDYAQDPVIWKD